MQNEIQKIFSNIYNNNLWSMNQNESRSGLGSTIQFSKGFSKHLVGLIKKNNIQKIFDCSCGDWNWMSKIQADFPTYVGNDVVEPLIQRNQELFGNERISFVCNDAVSQLSSYNEKAFDLVILRHTLEHLPEDYNLQLLQQVQRVSKYAIITSYNGKVVQNMPLKPAVVPYRPINLLKSPYSDMLASPLSRFWDAKWPRKLRGTYGFIYSFD